MMGEASCTGNHEGSGGDTNMRVPVDGTATMVSYEQGNRISQIV